LTGANTRRYFRVK